MATATIRKQSRDAAHGRRKARKPRAFPTREERAAGGRALRDKVPRKIHGDWKLPRGHRDPIQILEKSNRGRLSELVPIRYGRMLHSPFTFLRGSAAVMAYDLAKTPNTGLRVQACGDCHLMNFGLFATPERHLVFDVNDFDETHPAPWEWDLKRLAASFVIAARDNRLSRADARDVVVECLSAYREHMRECSAMTPMEVWYERLDMDTLIETAPDAEARKFRQQLAKQARQRIIEHLFPKIAEVAGGRHQLVDQPPILVHVAEPGWEEHVRLGVTDYRLSLSDERRVLLDRYRLEDFALKVVGIGSVGTRCYIALLISDESHPLMLQFKEAGRSVLEPYTERSEYDNQGQRVVLRDMKMSIPLEGLSALQLTRYAKACGWTLARAHAKSGDASAISGYLGKGDSFDRALASFGAAYADQTERDHAALVKAVRSGRIEALSEE